MDQGRETIMSSLFSKLFKSPSSDYDWVPQTAESPAASGTGGRDIRLERVEDLDMISVFVSVIQDEPGQARDIVRAMSPRDRALLSFVLGEVTRLVSEEDDFRRTADRRRAREDALGSGDTDG
jgi:hypothetical protein